MSERAGARARAGAEPHSAPKRKMGQAETELKCERRLFFPSRFSEQVCKPNLLPRAPRPPRAVGLGGMGARPAQWQRPGGLAASDS
eukprot:1122322-Pyramimonas_sp.AAC.1